MGLITGYPSGSGELDPTHRVASTGKQLCALGFWNSDGLGNEYIYVQAGAAIPINSCVKLAASATPYAAVIQTTAAAGQPIFGVATAAFSFGTGGDFGFIQIRGVCNALANAAVVAGNLLVQDSTTAGQLQLATATDLAGAKAVHCLVAPVSNVASVLLQ